MNTNKLIAKFMGYKKLHKKFQVKSYNSSNEYYWEWEEGDVVCNPDGDIVENYEQEPISGFKELTFDESWELMMKVVDKIGDLGYNISISRSWVELRVTSDSKMGFFEIVKGHSNRGGKIAKLEATNIVVVEFIKYYNEKIK